MARKEWRCICADPAYRHPDLAIRANHCLHNHGGECLGEIPPGATYVEYLGEAAAYGSGHRYCLPCGIKAWSKERTPR